MISSTPTARSFLVMPRRNNAPTSGDLVSKPMRSPASGPLTVSVAVAKYIASLADNGRPTGETQARAAVHILPALGSLLVEDLTTERLRRWLADMAKLPARVRGKRGAAPRYKLRPENEETQRRRQSTANRNLTVLKAALNHCFDERLAKSNDAWGRRLKPFRQVDAVRNRFLDMAEAKRLINAADPDFRNLVRAALHTGARYSELARMTVADFHSDSGTVAIGRSKSGKPRHVSLTTEGVHSFGILPSDAPGTNHVAKVKRQRVENRRAGTTNGRCGPSRQDHASDIVSRVASHVCVSGGHGWRPLHVLAKNLGHVDTRMVERVYGHLEECRICETRSAPVLRASARCRQAMWCQSISGGA